MQDYIGFSVLLVLVLSLERTIAAGLGVTPEGRDGPSRTLHGGYASRSSNGHRWKALLAFGVGNQGVDMCIERDEITEGLHIQHKGRLGLCDVTTESATVTLVSGDLEHRSRAAAFAMHDV